MKKLLFMGRNLMRAQFVVILELNYKSFNKTNSK